MINETTLREWLRPVTYRPGWEIRSYRLSRGLCIIIKAIGEDTNDPQKQFSASPLYYVPDEIFTPDQLYDWILDVCIPGIDTHERWEWFRVDGQKWRDPHAPHMPAFAVNF